MIKDIAFIVFGILFFAFLVYMGLIDGSVGK
jgi:hypothetical protein